jgi:hypothetical protein
MLISLTRICPTDPSSSTYAGWGNTTNGDRSTVPEPNQLGGVENCAVGNSSTLVKKKWGWADTDCNTPYVSICKFQRKYCFGCDCRYPRPSVLVLAPSSCEPISGHPTLPM